MSKTLTQPEVGHPVIGFVLVQEEEDHWFAICKLMVNRQVRQVNAIGYVAVWHESCLGWKN